MKRMKDHMCGCDLVLVWAVGTGLRLPLTGWELRKGTRKTKQEVRWVVATWVSTRLEQICDVRIEALKKEPGPCVLSLHKRR